MSPPPLPADQHRDETDRWFLSQGVPHFIAGYSARTDVWTRAVPALSVLFVLGVVAELGLAAVTGLGTFVAGIALVVAVWLGLNRLRGQPVFALPRRVGRLEPLLFVAVPAVVSAVRSDAWVEPVVTALVGSALLGAVYVITSYGLVAIVRFVLGELTTQLRLLGTISSRAVPMLLLITMTIYITGETWQMAARLKGLSFVATIGLFILVGGLFLWTRVPALIASVERFDDWAEVGSRLVGTPLAGAVLPMEGDPEEPPIRRGEWFNMAVLALATQAVQITLVAVVVWLFFVLLGLVAIRPDTAEQWLGAPAHPLLGVLSVGESRFAVTEEGLRVAAFLASFAGLTFTVYLTTDEAYRREFRTDVTDRIRQLLAVRLVDRHLTHGSLPAGREPGSATTA
ncbi:MAG: hypothetical protein R2761_03605 [Acidimicrobiales bacterium]